MSDEDADQRRAKRRRCAPKRYDEEDHETTAKETTCKHSPADKHRQQQQHGLSFDWDQPTGRHLNQGPQGTTAESEDDRALRIIQELAAKLERHDRPQLGVLFSASSNELARSASIRSVPLGFVRNMTALPSKAHVAAYMVLGAPACSGLSKSLLPAGKFCR